MPHFFFLQPSQVKLWSWRTLMAPQPSEQSTPDTRRKVNTRYMWLWHSVSCSSAQVFDWLVLSLWRPADGLRLFLRGSDQHVQGTEESRCRRERTVQWAPSAGERTVQTSGGRIPETAFLPCQSVCWPVASLCWLTISACEHLSNSHRRILNVKLFTVCQTLHRHRLKIDKQSLLRP